jgi:23S rRNA pseudouridine1911/1915/1917 synthase
MSGERLRFDTPDEAAGQRLDRFLSEQLAGTTRSALRRMIQGGRVQIDGNPVTKPGSALRGGMRIELTLPDPPSETPEPEEIPLRVLHEDDHLVVVDKAAGMVVHPTHVRRRGTVVNALLARGTTLAPTGGPDRPGIVHRLDRGTSGLLLVAKTEQAHMELARAFAERRVAKRYTALVWGHPEPAAGRIERSIGRSRAHPHKMAVRGTRGRTRMAVTEYDTLEAMPGFALVDVRPETGRTHQIRVHMQSIHHPLVGDDRYGGRAWRGVQDPLKRKALRQFDRLGLHAVELALKHPVTDEPLRFRAPLPDEFDSLLQALRGKK